MIYASSYRQKKYYDNLDEIHFSSINNLMHYYVDEKGTKSCCLEILDVKETFFNGEEITPNVYLDLITKYPQLRLVFYQLTDLYNYIETEPDKAHGNYYFNYPADNYNMLNTLLQIGVSDIVLDEPLVFDIERVRNYIFNKTSNQDLRIHIRPYLGKPGWMPEKESIIHHFWVLPQDIDLYEPYVDVVDLFAISGAREAKLIEDYCIKHETETVLGALVENRCVEDLKMPAAMITEDLVLDRLDCRQICMSTYPQRCHKCDLQYIAFKVIDEMHHKTKSQS